MRRAVCLGVMLATGFVATVQAQPRRASHRQRFTEAVVAYERRDFARADALFMEVFHGVRACMLLVNAGRARAEIPGREGEALEVLRQALSGRDCEMRRDQPSIAASAGPLVEQLERRLAQSDAGSSDALAVVDASVIVDVASAQTNADAGAPLSDAVVSVTDAPSVEDVASSRDVPVLPPSLPVTETTRVNRISVVLWGTGGGALLIGGLFWGWYIDARGHIADPTQGGSTARWQRASDISFGAAVGFTVTGVGLGIAGTVLYMLRPLDRVPLAMPVITQSGAGLIIGGRF